MTLLRNQAFSSTSTPRLGRDSSWVMSPDASRRWMTFGRPGFASSRQGCIAQEPPPCSLHSHIFAGGVRHRFTHPHLCPFRGALHTVLWALVQRARVGVWLWYGITGKLMRKKMSLTEKKKIMQCLFTAPWITAPQVGPARQSPLSCLCSRSDLDLPCASSFLLFTLMLH